MKTQAERGEYWLSRYQVGTVVFDAQGERIDLLNWLITLKNQALSNTNVTFYWAHRHRYPAACSFGSSLKKPLDVAAPK